MRHKKGTPTLGQARKKEREGREAYEDFVRSVGLADEVANLLFRWQYAKRYEKPLPPDWVWKAKTCLGLLAEEDLETGVGA